MGFRLFIYLFAYIYLYLFTFVLVWMCRNIYTFYYPSKTKVQYHNLQQQIKHHHFKCYCQITSLITHNVFWIDRNNIREKCYWNSYSKYVSKSFIDNGNFYVIRLKVWINQVNHEYLNLLPTFLFKHYIVY